MELSTGTELRSSAIRWSHRLQPTDVVSLARWAKRTRALQSVLSIVVLSVVAANAINLFG